jgi:hypothetical protein
MNRTLQSALAILALTVSISVGVLGFAGYRAITALSTTLSRINAALDTINRPKSGTLSMLDDTILQGRLTIDAANKVAIHEQQQLGAIDGYASHLDREVSNLAGSGSRTLDAITGTARGATDTLSAAQTDLKTLDTSLTAFPPLLERSTATVGDLDALLKDKAVYGTLDNVQSMTSSGSAILIDARTLADKTTGDILKPKPWWQKIGPYGNDLVRAGCLLTGRCP